MPSCDVALAVDAAELKWASQLNSVLYDESWCSRVNLFDSRSLFGRSRPGAGVDNIRRSDAERRRERAARCATSRFVPPHECYMSGFKWLY